MLLPQSNNSHTERSIQDCAIVLLYHMFCAISHRLQLTEVTRLWKSNDWLSLFLRLLRTFTVWGNMQVALMLPFPKTTTCYYSQRPRQHCCIFTYSSGKYVHTPGRYNRPCVAVFDRGCQEARPYAMSSVNSSLTEGSGCELTNCGINCLHFQIPPRISHQLDECLAVK